MNEILSQNVFFVKEHTGIFKAANNYDIHDPNTGQIIMECREENLGFFTKLLRFLSGEVELAHVTKKWAGLGKEMFTSADNYVLEISATVPADSVARQLILAAVMCIDMVLKE